MNRYMVARQDVNCGQTREIWVKTLDEANRAFEIAVSAGVQFAEIFDGVTDSQIRMHLTPATHLKF